MHFENIKALRPILLKNVFVAMASVLLISSCTQKAQTIHPHDGDQREQGNILATLSKSEHPNQTENNVDKWKKQARDSKNIFQDVLLPLANKLLRPQWMGLSESQLDPEIRQELSFFNEQLLREGKLVLSVKGGTQGKADFISLLDRYVEASAFSCDEIVSDCPGLHFLRNAPNSSQVLKLAAKNALTVNEYYRRLSLALALKNGQEDEELLRLFAERMDEYLAKVKSQKDRQLFQSVFNASLALWQQLQKDTQGSRSFLHRIQAWKLIFSRENILSDPSKVVLMRAMAQSDLLYQENGRLSSSFVVEVESSQKGTKSFTNRQKILSEQKVFLPQALGMAILSDRDEYFTIVDQVFNQTMSVEVANELLLGSRQDNEKLGVIMEKYLRVQFLYSLYLSTLKARDKMFSSKIMREKLLPNALEVSQEIGGIWSEFRSRAAGVEILLRHLKDQSGKIALDGHRERRLENFFSGINKSIKMIGSYPQVMVLFYLLSKSHFEFRHPLLPGKMFDSSDLIGLLYQGKFPPLFHYSDDVKVISQAEMIYVFDFAVRTNLLTLSNIDPDEFIADSLQRFSQDDMKYVQESLLAIRSRYGQSADFRSLKEFCAEIKDRKSVIHHFHFQESQLSPYYGNLMDLAFTSISDKREGSHIGQGLNFMDRPFAESLERVRVNLKMALWLGQAMRESYVTYLRDSLKVSSEQIRRKTLKTEERIAEIEKLRRDYVQEADQRYREVGVCLPQMVLKTQTIQEKVLLAEREYLEGVYKDIGEMRTKKKNGGQFADTSSISSKYRLKDLPQGFSGRDKIDENGYLYSSIDFQIRMARYMKNIAPNVRMDMGFDWSDEADMMSESKEVYLPYTPTEKEFVRNAMILLIGEKSKGMAPWLLWYGSLTRRMVSWQERLLSLASWYRLDMESDSWDRKLLLSPEVLLSEHHLLLQLLEITEFEREIFVEVSKTTKYLPEYLDHIQLDFDSIKQQVRQIWGLFDFPAKLATTELLGENYVYDPLVKEEGLNEDRRSSQFIAANRPQRDGVWTVARKYFEVRAKGNRSELAIAYSSSLDQWLDERLRSWVGWESTRVDRFQDSLNKKIEEYKKLSSESRPRFDLSTQESFTEPWIQDNIMGNYKANFNRFHRDTHNCFLKDQACPDFQ